MGGRANLRDSGGAMVVVSSLSSLKVEESDDEEKLVSCDGREYCWTRASMVKVRLLRWTKMGDVVGAYELTGELHSVSQGKASARYAWLSQKCLP